MTTSSTGPRPPEAGGGPEAFPAPHDPEPATVPADPAPDAGTEPDAGAEAEEAARLRAEVEVLRARVDTRRRRASAWLAVRRVAAAVLVAVTAFAIIASVIGLWAANTTLNTNKWVSTVAPLPQDPKIAKAVGQYSTQQLFEALDVEQRIRTVLPQQAAFVAGPLTSQIHGAVQDTVTKVLQSDRFQTIWIELNRRAHQRALAIIEGKSELATAEGDHVAIDLLPLINQVLRQLSAQLPTLFGKTITLPDLSSGEIPADLRTKVQDALGVTLPANFAQFTLYDAGRLRAVQQAVVTVKRDLVILVVSTLLLLALALLISPRRRRTLLQLGLWLVIAAVSVTAIVRAVRGQLLDRVPKGIYRDAASDAVTTVFASLRARGTQIIWIGAVLAILMYLVGPGRFPVWLRHHIALGLRALGRWIRDGSRVVASRGPGWTAHHLDPIRIAGVILAVALALILSSWTALLVIALALTAFEVAVTIVGRTAARHEQAPADTVAEIPPAHPSPG